MAAVCTRRTVSRCSARLSHRRCSHMSALLQLCADRHYIPRPQRCCGYGPLGTELRKNLVEQWWSSVVTCRPQVFGISTSHYSHCGSSMKRGDGEAVKSIFSQKELGREQMDVAAQKVLVNSVSLRSSLLKGALEHYITSLNLVNRKLPFGLAETGVCYPQAEEPTEAGRPSETLQTSLVWFCSSRTSSHWLDYWARHRLQWWRKFALSPSNFSLSDDGASGEEGEKAAWRVMLLYQYPWGTETLETLSSLGDSALLETHPESLTQLQCRERRRYIVPSVISVSGNIDRGVLAYLHNSLHEVKRMDSKQKLQTRKVLKLHPRLAPFKVALFMGKGSSLDLRQLCDGLLQELLEGGISAWPGHQDTMHLSMEQLSSKYDEMGVLFTVMMSDTTLENGLVHLRSRDTAIKETMHISEVKNFLAKYIMAAETV